MFRYQWRAFWRRVLRTGRLKFYLTGLTLLGAMAAGALPESLSRAAGELSAGQTASMDRLLLVLCLLWVFVLGEDLHVSLSGVRLRRFPVDARSLLALRFSSLFLSPIVWLATIVSLLGLLPLLTARHALLGSLAALVLFALTIGIRITVSQSLATDRRTTVLLVGVSAGLIAANPTRLVTTVAVATTPSAIAGPVAILLVSGAVILYLVFASFRRGLYYERNARAVRRATSIARLPGRLGPLVLKEQRSFSRVWDVWFALFLVLAVAGLSLFASLPTAYHQAVFVIVCAVNTRLTLNGLGLDRPAAFTRYLILPLRAQDLFLAKNVAVTIVVGLQLVVLLAIRTWRSGVVALGGEIVVILVLLLAHLAWGNVVSVLEPHRSEPHGFASGGDHVTTMVSLVIASAPGVAVIVLLGSGSPVAALAIAMIVVATSAAYYGSLRYAGGCFERRIEAISRRLA